MMDAALLRPGRFCKSIRVPLPDADGRASILKALSRKKPIDDSVDFHAIARMKECENLTGAHLAVLVCVLNFSAFCALISMRVILLELCENAHLTCFSFLFIVKLNCR